MNLHSNFFLNHCRKNKDKIEKEYKYFRQFYFYTFTFYSNLFFVIMKVIKKSKILKKTEFIKNEMCLKQR